MGRGSQNNGEQNGGKRGFHLCGICMENTGTRKFKAQNCVLPSSPPQTAKNR
jgi:hypothetical protein